jgi:enolase
MAISYLPQDPVFKYVMKVNIREIEIFLICLLRAGVQDSNETEALYTMSIPLDESYIKESLKSSVSIFNDKLRTSKSISKVRGTT